MLECLKSGDWLALTGTTFEVHLHGDRIQAWELDAVREWGTPGAAGRMPYTLTFLGPMQDYVAQGIHRLEHPALGMLEIFFVPVGPTGGRMCYEAVFS